MTFKDWLVDTENFPPYEEKLFEEFGTEVVKLLEAAYQVGHAQGLKDGYEACYHEGGPGDRDYEV